jgi:predicted dinucleotide-binding enzyme
MPKTIAIVSARGAEGLGPASRFARAGARVIVGSRDKAKAEEAAGRIGNAEAILVDATVPLEAAIGGRVSRPLTLWAGPKAQQDAQYAPPGVRVTAAFHTPGAELLAQPDQPMPGARAVDAGPLENARLLESAAALVISLNIRHKIKHSGFRITGVEK